jgi:hypothetical protein
MVLWRIGGDDAAKEAQDDGDRAICSGRGWLRDFLRLILTALIAAFSVEAPPQIGFLTDDWGERTPLT